MSGVSRASGVALRRSENTKVPFASACSAFCEALAFRAACIFLIWVFSQTIYANATLSESRVRRHDARVSSLFRFPRLLAHHMRIMAPLCIPFTRGSVKLCKDAATVRAPMPCAARASLSASLDGLVFALAGRRVSPTAQKAWTDFAGAHGGAVILASQAKWEAESDARRSRGPPRVAAGARGGALGATQGVPRAPRVSRAGRHRQGLVRAERQAQEGAAPRGVHVRSRSVGG